MNSRRRNQSFGRPGAPQVQFCQRCGGVISSPGGASNNVCRCSKEERERHGQAVVDRTQAEPGT
jgi:hypothetical protein